MHLLLTDRLTCPRCGPGFGLILRADRREDRIVHQGVLGCPNCRDSFSIEDGFGDLRAPPRRELGAGLAGAPGAEASSPQAGAEAASRLIALLGVVAGGGTVVLAGGPARHAAAVAAALPELQVVGIDPDLRLWPEQPGVNRLAASPGLPFFDGTLRAVALDGRLGPTWLREAARTVARKGRVVVSHADDSAPDALTEQGLDVLAAEAETVVATRN